MPKLKTILNLNKYLITIILLFNNLMLLGQNTFKIVESDGLYGIVLNHESRYNEVITPCIFNELSSFYFNGYSIAVRRFPILSISEDFKDTIYWPKFYPDKYLANYKILNTNLEDNFLLSNGIDTFSIPKIYYTTEQSFLHQFNDYIDTVGNYFLNLLPTPKFDSFINYQHFMQYRYGVVDSNGKITQPLVFDEIKEQRKELSNQPNWFQVVYKNKIGFLDSNAKVIISPIFDLVPDSFRFEPGKDYPFTWTNGNYPEPYLFNCNFCKVFKNGKIGVIDSNGKFILPCEFKFIEFKFTCEKRDHLNSSWFETADFENNYKKYDKNGRLLTD